MSKVNQFMVTYEFMQHMTGQINKTDLKLPDVLKNVSKLVKVKDPFHY